MSLPPETLRALDDAVRTDIHALRDTYFWWLVFSAVAVAVGVAVEAPEVIKDIREQFSRYRPSRKTEKAIVLVSAIGLLLVATGVAGEFVLEALVSKADTLAQSFESILLADAQRSAGDAIERAGNANKEAGFARLDASNANTLAKKYQAQIADSDARVKVAEAQVATAMARSDEAMAQVRTADARIAEAQRQAAEADRGTAEAKLELAKLTTPRTLSKLQRDELIRALKSFPRTEFMIGVNPIPEAINLATEISSVLLDSG